MKYKITENRYNIPEDVLFTVGKRANNAKRDFLFISKVLGKHLAVNPEVVRATGYVLSSLLYEFDNAEYIDCLINKTKPEYKTKAKDVNALVIGFCETATGLGMAVADSIDGSTYIHTTREDLKGMPVILAFEEEHSHATTHRLCSNWVNLKEYDQMILVDDEITTGNSMLNLIKQLNQQSGCTKFDILTILDWRNENYLVKYEDFQKETGIEVTVKSIIKGQLEETDSEFIGYEAPELEIKKYPDVIKSGLTGGLARVRYEIDFDLTGLGLNLIWKMKKKHTWDEDINFTSDSYRSYTDYWEASGRFGVKQEEFEKAEQKVKEAAYAIKLNTTGKTVKKVLVLAEGESIYWPSRFAVHLAENFADNNFDIEVDFRTTSLSPIYPDGEVIKDCGYYMMDDKKYYFYNKEEAEGYDFAVFVSEKHNYIPQLIDKMFGVRV